MATTRPLMQLGIGDLEEVFEKQAKNFATLARLKYELSHRQVPRAVALLERVNEAEALLRALDSQNLTPRKRRTTPRLNPQVTITALDSAPELKELGLVSSGNLSSPPEQIDLLTGVLPPTATPTSGQVSATSPSTNVTPIKKDVTTSDSEALPQLALEDACRILKVVASDPWEKVEAARRRIVIKSSPLVVEEMSTAQVQKLLAEAKMANDAAIVIAARRCGRR